METFDFGKTKLIALVFDLSIAHDKKGRRIIDGIKSQIVKKISKSNEEVLFFLNKIPKHCGESVQEVASYQDPIDFNIGETVKKITKIIGETSEDKEKYVLFITDRFKDKFKGHYKSIFNLKKYKNYDFTISFVGFGKNYDRSILESLVLECEGNFQHIDLAEDLSFIFEKMGV
jgi:hypothetical protein